MATTAKPRPASPGAGRLDARVQSQKIGLESDFVNDADDLADLARRLLDATHGAHRFTHDSAGFFRFRFCR